MRSSTPKALLVLALQALQSPQALVALVALVAPLALVASLAVLPACRPLFEINADTGRRTDEESLPLCERVVSRMIRCSSDPEFRERLEGDRVRAVRACEGAGRKDAERCDAKETCDAFVRCLRE